MNCRFCGSGLPEAARFCQACGARTEPPRVWPSEVPSAGRLQASAPVLERAVPGQGGWGSIEAQEGTSEQAEALYIDPIHIISMSLISGGLYSLYWMFLTWKQLQRETRQDHHAVWHAIAVYAPIYGLFRSHKHIEVIRDLSLRSGIGTGMVPIIFVFLFGIGASFDMIGSLAGVSLMSALLIFIFGLAIETALLLWAQGDLNAYWLHTRRERLTETNLGIGEVIITGLGALNWLAFVVGYY